MKSSLSVSLIAVFAALTMVCDVLVFTQLSSGVWYGLVFLIEPLSGIVLEPKEAFLSTLIGVLVGHTLIPRGMEEFLFTLGAPLGAAVSSLFFRGYQKSVLFLFTGLLGIYVVNPISWILPIWGMWDIYVAYIVTLLMTILPQNETAAKLKSSNILFGLSALIGLETDILFRIFIFIPCQAYRYIYGFPIEVLQAIWVSGALITPLKVAAATLLSIILGPRILKAFKPMQV